MRRLKIRPRLTLSFVAIILLMLVASVVGIWQLNNIYIQAQRLHNVDRELQAILRVQNSLLRLNDSLQFWINSRNADKVTAEVPRLSDEVVAELNNAIDILSQSTTRNNDSYGRHITQLKVLRDTLPNRLESVVELARVNDWSVLGFRANLLLEDEGLEVGRIVDQITAIASLEQEEATQAMNAGINQSISSFAVAGLLTTTLAVLLGQAVTNSISRPLQELVEGTDALARGEFTYKIEDDENDEVTKLTQAFNNAAIQLAELYTTLETKVQQRTNELHRRAMQLETNFAVSQRITQILTLDVLLSQVVDLIQDRYGYHYLGIFLFDTDRHTLVARAGTGEAGQALCDDAFQITLNQQHAFGLVASNNQSLQIDDITNDNRYLPLPNIANIRSELVLPLQMGTTFLGVLDIRSERSYAFQADDALALQTLADQVAIAIQNSFRYHAEQSRRQLAETLYTSGRAISSTLNLTEVLDLILTHLTHIVPCDRAAILLRHDEVLEIAAAQGFPVGVPIKNIQVPINPGDVFDQINQSKTPLAINDVQERTDWQQVTGLRLTRSWMGLPLIRLDRVIGMLSLSRTEVYPYNDDQLALASAFASQAAIAIENARLYHDVQTVSQQLEALVAERTQELSQAYSQLETLDQTKSDFINVAAHELRTPLTVLRGYSQMLLHNDTIQSDEFLTQMIDSIHSGTQRLHVVVNSMLDIAKIDSRALEIYPEPVSIMTVLELTHQKFADVFAERQQQLVIDDLAHLPAIEADPDALQKVFHHLVGNAIKYTPDGGTVTISGCPTDHNTNGIEIVVSDTGIGIDPTYHELIFTKFYQTGELALHSSGQTKFKGAGPGLGLTVVRGIIEAHHGKIWVESTGYDEEHNPGSHFHVFLPLRQPEANLPKRSPELIPDAP